jgi:hypothetical protein
LKGQLAGTARGEVPAAIAARMKLRSHVNAPAEISRMRVDTHFPGNDPATLGGIVYAAAAVRAIPTLVTESFIGAAALLIIIGTQVSGLARRPRSRGSGSDPTLAARPPGLAGGVVRGRLPSLG